MLLQQLIQKPIASSKLVVCDPFRMPEPAELVKEVIGLANADVDGPRYILFGINPGGMEGSKIVGIKVIGETTGTPIGFGRALGRQLFAGFISSQIFYLGYLWMLWDDKKQTWHDKVVNSIVVKV